eukprot:TRINITY_DN1319_c0_g1_i1.p1 TRINITY_DN1319_c0_g1~~TRINITY_DN1319_c0_g1_i1.p1  ORF type:complete len:115 (-),score=12.29 TRINITY_DN1319_c0_g1_i1:39-383(-)
MKFLIFLCILLTLVAAVYSSTSCSGADQNKCEALHSKCLSEQSKQPNLAMAYCICDGIEQKCYHKIGCVSDADYNAFVTKCTAEGPCSNKQCASSSFVSISIFVVSVCLALFIL